MTLAIFEIVGMTLSFTMNMDVLIMAPSSNIGIRIRQRLMPEDFIAIISLCLFRLLKT